MTTAPTKPTAAFSDLSSHPIADIFPLMEGPEFDALVKDIKDNGMREPITMFEDKILDGRNRYRAVVKAGHEYKLKEENFRPYTGSDPVGFVISANLHRRHLNESQRASIAGQLVTTKLGDNQHKGGFTIKDAATTFRVSQASVKKAKEVAEKAAPEVKEMVRQGTLRLGAVKEVLDLPKEQQAATLEKKKEEKKAERQKKQQEQQQQPKKAAKSNQAMKDVDDFKAKWQGFNDMQRKAFVMSFKDELGQILAYVREQEAMIGAKAA
jgi:ParB-like chromosome segregation protein Spo0J